MIHNYTSISIWGPGPRHLAATPGATRHLRGMDVQPAARAVHSVLSVLQGHMLRLHFAQDISTKLHVTTKDKDNNEL